MRQVVLPLTENSPRFAERGYPMPRPFLDVHGKALIEHIIDSVMEPEDQVILLCREEDMAHVAGTTSLLNRSNVVFHYQRESAQGAVCDILAIEPLLDNDDPLLIVTCENYVRFNHARFAVESENADGLIITFPASHPKWSYARVVDGTRRVVEVAEKRAISPHATAGIYFFAHGCDFVSGAHRMIGAKKRVNDEFCICPVYNELIARLRHIEIFPSDAMFGLSTPEDFEMNRPYIRTDHS